MMSSKARMNKFCCWFLARWRSLFPLSWMKSSQKTYWRQHVIVTVEISVKENWTPNVKICFTNKAVDFLSAFCSHEGAHRSSKPFSVGQNLNLTLKELVVEVCKKKKVNCYTAPVFPISAYEKSFLYYSVWQLFVTWKCWNFNAPCCLVSQLATVPEGLAIPAVFLG